MWRFFFIFVKIMAKANKDTIVTEILLLLESGISRRDCLSKIVKKWQMSDRTFDRHWKVANKIHTETQSEIQNSISETAIEVFRENYTGHVLTKLERQAILTQIALGNLQLTKYIVADGVIQERDVVPNYADRRAAIQELNKMDGAYLSDIDPDEEITEVVIRRITSNGTGT